MAFPIVACPRCGADMEWTRAGTASDQVGQIGGLWCPVCDTEIDARGSARGEVDALP